MRTLLLLLLRSVVVVSIASAPITVAAQDGSAEATADLPLVVAGDGGCTVVDRGSASQSYPLVQEGSGVRDQWLECEYAMSDPRVSGSGSLLFNDDCFVSPGGRACVMWGANLIVGPDGRWACTWSGTGDPTGLNDGLASAVCKGTEAYAGLTYMWQTAVAFSGKGDFGDGTNMYGLIYEGPPPPVGEPVSDPVLVVVARQDARAGYVVLPTMRVVCAVEAGPDALTDLGEAKGRRAAVDIPAGQPITADLLEPLPDEP